MLTNKALVFFLSLSLLARTKGYATSSVSRASADNAIRKAVNCDKQLRKTVEMPLAGSFTADVDQLGQMDFTDHGQNNERDQHQLNQVPKEGVNNPTAKRSLDSTIRDALQKTKVLKTVNNLLSIDSFPNLHPDKPTGSRQSRRNQFAAAGNALSQRQESGTENADDEDSESHERPKTRQGPNKKRRPSASSKKRRHRKDRGEDEDDEEDHSAETKTKTKKDDEDHQVSNEVDEEPSEPQTKRGSRRDRMRGSRKGGRRGRRRHRDRAGRQWRHGQDEDY